MTNPVISDGERADKTKMFLIAVGNVLIGAATMEILGKEKDVRLFSGLAAKGVEIKRYAESFKSKPDYSKYSKGDIDRFLSKVLKLQDHVPHIVSFFKNSSGYAGFKDPDMINSISYYEKGQTFFEYVDKSKDYNLSLVSAAMGRDRFN